MGQFQKRIKCEICGKKFNSKKTDFEAVWDYCPRNPCGLNDIVMRKWEEEEDKHGSLAHNLTQVKDNNEEIEEVEVLDPIVIIIDKNGKDFYKSGQ